MRYLIPLLLVMSTLAGCQTLDTRSDERKLEATLAAYGTAVRWQPLVGLYAYLQPELQPDAPPAGLDNIRVTGYDVTGSPRELAEGKVAQTALIEYVLVDRQQVRRMIDNQLWVKNADGEWQRANPIPPFK